ncbi:alpha-1,2-mannosyltransferase (Kre5) [Ascosphaera acerosa]|nr:alpha-1,2-mannosyltransferase (Kre5) [Ascosphaera acerosa]
MGVLHAVVSRIPFASSLASPPGSGSTSNSASASGSGSGSASTAAYTTLSKANSPTGLLSDHGSMSPSPAGMAQSQSQYRDAEMTAVPSPLVLADDAGPAGGAGAAEGGRRAHPYSPSSPTLHSPFSPSAGRSCRVAARLRHALVARLHGLMRRRIRIRSSSTFSIPLPFVLLFPCVVIIMVVVLIVTHPQGSRSLLLPTGSPPAISAISEKYDKVFATGCLPIDTSGPRANAAIVVLARNKELDGVVKSMRSLERHFNRWWKYPYVFLNDGDFDDAFMETVRNHTRAAVEFGKIDSTMWGFPDWMDAEVAREGIRKQGDAALMYGGLESYHHMCRFNSGFFFRHPSCSRPVSNGKASPGGAFSRAQTPAQALMTDEHGPTVKSSQSNTIVPVKSHLVEDSDSGGEEDDEVTEHDHDRDRDHSDGNPNMRRSARSSVPSRPEYESSHQDDSFALEKMLLRQQQKHSNSHLARIAELEKTINELKEELSSRETEKSQWEAEKQTHFDTSEKLAESEAAFHAQEVELATLRQLREEQKQQLEKSSEHEAQRTEWETTRADLEDRLQELQEQNEKLTADIERIQADHEFNIQQTTAEFAQEKRIWDEEKDILQVKLIQAEAKNDGIDERIEILEREHQEQMQKQAERSTDGFAKETEEWELLAKSLQAKLAESESRRLEAQEELSVANEKHAATLQDTREQTRMDMEAETAELREKVAELQAQLTTSEAHSLDVKNELNAALRDLEKKSKECEEIKDKLETSKSEHVTQMKEVEKSMETLIAVRGRDQSDAADWQQRHELLRHEHAKLQGELQQALQTVDDLNRQLASEQSERAARSMLVARAMTHDDADDLKQRYDALEEEHQALKRELKDQHKVTEQVRKQAETFLAEMRELSEQGGSNLEREESLNKEIARLGEEVRIWKERYARTRTRLRGLRSSTLGLPGMEYNISLFEDNDLLSSDGMVRDVHVTKFQMSVDELLRSARMGEPQLVLEKVKNVVTAIRGLNQDLEVAGSRATAAANPLQAQNGPLSPPTAAAGVSGLPAPIRKLKARVAATANNLITTTKNYAQSNGLSPVSLLDAAASHLCSALVALVRTVKIRPTPADELGDDDDVDDVEEVGAKGVQSPSVFSVAHSQATAIRISRDEGESLVSADLDISARGSGSQAGSHSRSVTPQGSGLDAMAANVSRLLDEHQQQVEKGERASVTPNRPQPSVTPPPTTLATPPPRVQSLQHAAEHDEELEDLRMYIDDQTANLLRSIDALVTNVYAALNNPTPDERSAALDSLYHPTIVREHLDTITAIIEHVSIATEQILTTQTGSVAHMRLRQHLHVRVTPVLEQLTRGRESLLSATQKCSAGSTRTETAARIEQLAYALGRDMKLLVATLDPRTKRESAQQPQTQPQPQSQPQQTRQGGSAQQEVPYGDHCGDDTCNRAADDSASEYEDDDVSDYGAGETATVASVAHVGTPTKARTLYKATN